MEKYIIAANLCILLSLLGCTTPKNTTQKNYHEEEWVVRLAGGHQVASLLALRSGYINRGLVLGFKDTYIWHKNHRQINKRSSERLMKDLTSNSEIMWADRQRNFQRTKRDLLDIPESEKPLVRQKRVLNNEENDIDTHSDVAPMFNDPEWKAEWFRQDTRRDSNLPKMDLHVLPLYRLGITGRGVNIAVVDDGIEYTHEDLRKNYNPDISYDITERDNDPMPRYYRTDNDSNCHGTRCAGEIAMEANNGKCGVGVAFEASIGGIKMLDGTVTDRTEGEALGYKQDLIDIYTASWGPIDDGKAVDGPKRIAIEAFERGVTKGRNGKGNIYVWSSGNGGGNQDHCSCDGYVGSIYTIAVGSVSQTGRTHWYSEECPAILTTTYGSDAKYEKTIATTDIHNGCTTEHSGTSASAPLTAGVIALALQVNKELTWRDVQHLIVQTSEHSPLSQNPGWIDNSAGFRFNPRFGFGLMNAHGLVSAAYNWTRVPEKNICSIKYQGGSQNISFNRLVSLVFYVDGCSHEDQEVRFLEHVEVETSISYTRRGVLNIYLTSPSGTRLPILGSRPLDDTDAGFKNWKFMSVATWGEDPRGQWRLDIIDPLGPPWHEGAITDAALILHGTKLPPKYIDKTFRINKVNYSRVENRGVVNDRESEINFLKNVHQTEDLVFIEQLHKILFG